MSKKYIMLFNFEHDDHDTKMIDAVMTMFPDAKLGEYTTSNPLYSPSIDLDGFSLWLPKKQFLACWMFINVIQTDEMKNPYVDDFLGEFTIQDGIEYMNSHLKQPEIFVKEL